MNLLAPVSTIMQTNLITVSPSDKVKKAEEIFNENRIHHIPVIDKGQLVGMVSKSDFLFFKRGFNDDQTDERLDLFRLRTHNINEIMTTGLAILGPDEKINVALEVFKENLFHAIPILNDGVLKGIVTTQDIIVQLASAGKADAKYLTK